MKFIENIEKNRYDNFVKNHQKSHFLQSYAWGEFIHKARGLTPHYVGITDDKDNLLCVSLLLEKRLPLGYTYFYAPRGFIINFKDKELLKFFVDNLKKFTKKKKGIFLKIDPDIIIRRMDKEDYESDFKETFDNIKKLGFKHLGFTKNFETSQPRYTFRINLEKTPEELFENFNKTTKRKILKAEKLHTVVNVGNEKDLKTFVRLMEMTEERKNFISHDYDYYKTLYEVFNKDGNEIKLFISTFNIKKALKETENDLKKVEKELVKINKKEPHSKHHKEFLNRKEVLTESINEFKEALKEYGEVVNLNIHVPIIYGNMAWGLYATNHNILMRTNSNYKTYYEQIKYCQQKGIKTFDVFGTIGDLREDNPLLGIHSYKKGFGGEYIEFIGEFDLILNKKMYLVFKKFIPFYRNIIRNRLKKKIKNNNK